MESNSSNVTTNKTASNIAASEIRPISHWSTNDSILKLVLPHLQAGAKIVDVGAGEGFFSKKMGDIISGAGRNPGSQLSACDLFPSGFKYSGIKCDAVPVNGILPYEDASFDVACSLEVVEHLEDQFLFARELFRIVKPGGVVFISTPNILNINSRLRVLRSGFPVLFDPLPISSSDPVHTSGHIHPISYYYLGHMLYKVGFTDVQAGYDRFKSSAKFLVALTAWYTALGNAMFKSRLNKKTPTVMKENEQLLAPVNSLKMLTSRSIVAIAKR